MDFEELRPQQQSFELLAAYLNGSTVNVTVDGQPQRYTGAYVTEDFLRVLGVAPGAGPRLHRRRQPPGRREGRAHRPRHLAARLRRRARHRRQGRPHQRQAGHDHRRDAARASRSRPTRSCGSRSTASSRCGARATTRATSTRRSSACCRPGVSLDQANAEFAGFAKRFAAAYPDTQQGVQHGPGAAADRDVHARARCAARS